MSSVSQKTDVQGQSCGACAASYILEELLGYTFAKKEVENLWRVVQFGKAWLPGFIEAEHTDPTKLLKALRRDYPQLKVAGLMAADSPLAYFTCTLADLSVIQVGDPMECLLTNCGWNVIGIYQTDGLHYVATKYEKGCYHLKDSNASTPTYVGGPKVMEINARFSVPLDEGIGSYSYLGAGLVVHL